MTARSPPSSMGAAMSDLVQRAREFAQGAHRRIDHRRKHSGQPYDVHLKAVADLVASVSDEVQTIAARHAADTGRGGAVFTGSSPGAASTGVVEVALG